VVSSAGASAASAAFSRAFLLSRCFGPSAARSRFGASPGLNCSHTPVMRRSWVTASLACAPVRSQCRARSSATRMVDGSSSGWYSPRISMNRPSRGDRVSAATMR
jgi:hypothetical protein